jgi:proline iminopeptidase
MDRPVGVLSMLLLVAPVSGCTARSTEAAPVLAARPPVNEGHLDAGNGVRLAYRIVGTGPDTLIVIHGGPGLTMDYLATDFEPLARRHALVFYDQRGTGRSTLVTDSTALTGARFAEDLEALRRHLRLERVNLLGHSWGAGVIALYAEIHPERLGRLVIVGGIPLTRAGLVNAFGKLDAGRDTSEKRRMEEAMAARIADPADAAACHAYYALWFRPFFADSASMRRSRGDFCAGSPDSRRNKMASVDRYTAASLGAWDWRPVMRTVEAPALVIQGTADPLLLESGREWAAAMPNSRLLVLDRIGHFPYVEAPERFFPPVDTFLSGRWPSGAAPVRAP